MTLARSAAGVLGLRRASFSSTSSLRVPFRAVFDVRTLARAITLALEGDVVRGVDETVERASASTALGKSAYHSAAGRLLVTMVDPRRTRSLISSYRSSPSTHSHDEKNRPTRIGQAGGRTSLARSPRSRA